ncbi:MAG: DNA-3-methyladenine glycosylase [Candidatus Lloydbacteria bacterium RIFCSPLOWO2_02_FULL_51_11]|uniref:DNA-3-methyladenine glycosylase n=1 Tax=Candidatus Lloydbacteria bacterium RIFCSPLOWO2_02_FULL_51_11 TaxID=1798667 RepID=A0A1G2DPM0_9BACT|nr:MAG: DNA-3-methyladenine glycosylase [Candidatus Lloydbacteria bacterium RIFCSPLOWO2_02_FULL_51_11]
MPSKDKIQRCPWVPDEDELYIAYHDSEWGVPVYDDRRIFEFLVLETFQAGLSWRTVLHKRAHFREAFSGFEYEKIARFSDAKVAALLKDERIIRNRAKIKAAIQNAKCLLAVRKEFGTFSKYMWSFVQGKPIVHELRTIADYPPYTNEAVVFAKDLKKRGFSFLGPTVVYSHMQAIGMVNDHTISCFRFKSV